MPVHGHAELGRDLDRAVGRIRVDHHQLVDEGDLVDQRALHALDDRPDRLLLVERRQADRDGHAVPLLQCDELGDVAELVGVERVLGEPLVHDDRQRARALDEGIGVGERPFRGSELVEGGKAHRLLGLDHDDGGLRLARHRFGEGAEQVPAIW